MSNQLECHATHSPSLGSRQSLIKFLSVGCFARGSLLLADPQRGPHIGLHCACVYNCDVTSLPIIIGRARLRGRYNVASLIFISWFCITLKFWFLWMKVYCMHSLTSYLVSCYEWLQTLARMSANCAIGCTPTVRFWRFPSRFLLYPGLLEEIPTSGAKTVK